MKETIRQWRLRHDWTQQEAADKLEMPLSTYKQRERGIRNEPGIMRVAMEGLDLKYQAK